MSLYLDCTVQIRYLFMIWYKGFLPFDFLDEILKQIVCYQMEPNHYKMGLLPILGHLLSHLVVLQILLESMPYSKLKTHKSEKIELTLFPHIGSFRGNYSFLNLEIVANPNHCHNISVFYLISWIFSMETIQGQKLYEEIGK